MQITSGQSLNWCGLKLEHSGLGTLLISNLGEDGNRTCDVQEADEFVLVCLPATDSSMTFEQCNVEVACDYYSHRNDYGFFATLAAESRLCGSSG